MKITDRHYEQYPKHDHFVIPSHFDGSWNSPTKETEITMFYRCIHCNHMAIERIIVQPDEYLSTAEYLKSHGFRDATIPF